MAYNLTDLQVLNGSNPCDNFRLNLEITKEINDPSMSSIIIEGRGEASGTVYSYPQDFLTTSENEVGGKIVYELLLEKARTDFSRHDILVVDSNGSSVILSSATFGESFDNSLFLLPFSWNLTEVIQTQSPAGVTNVDGEIRDDEGFVPTQETINSLGLEVSLDAVNYISGTAKTALSDGDYILYIRDSFGCVKQLAFTVFNDPELADDPFLFVSLLNSVRFAKRDELRRNPDNQLSYEETTDTNYKNWFNKMPVDDTLKIQYQSNYKSNKAFLLRDDGSFGELPVSRLTFNVGKKDIRDGLLSYDGTTATIKYPLDGNVYSETGDIIGSNNLEGDVLDQNQIGNFIFIEGRQGYEIIDIIQDSGFELMVIDFEGAVVTDEAVKIITLFDNFGFDYYEFNLSLDVPGCYQIAICDDNNFNNQDPLSTVKYLSERIMVTDDLDMTHKIEWQNNENNQFAWSTGIVSKMYVPYVMPPSYQAEDENEVYMTDTSQEMLESESFENYRFNFDLIPTAIVRQLQFAFGSSFLSIDDIRYLRKETPEIESQDGSNLYLMTPVLSRVTNYNSNSAKGVNSSAGLINITGILKLN